MKKTLLPLFLLGMVQLSHAQLKKLMEKPGAHISNFYTDFSSVNKTGFTAENAAATLGLGSGVNFIVKEKQSGGKNEVYRLTQTLYNIPVENSMYNVQVNAGKLMSAAGYIVTTIPAGLKNQSIITEKKAIELALQHAKAQQYMWQVALAENELKSLKKDNNATYYPTHATKVWYNAGKQLNADALTLAYKVDVFSAKPYDRAYYFIDASTGALLGKKQILNMTDAVGTGNTLYCGTRQIHSDQVSANSYRLRDYSRGGGVITLSGTLAGFGADFKNSSNNWNLKLPNQNAMDAHWGVAQTYDFYKKYFNRNSYDNLGSPLISHVNYWLFSSILVNASWDGSSMNYGQIYPGNKGLTAIDVTGHELTHGVTEYSSGLIYDGESGGMNESMSDIFGKAIQFYSRPDDINWEIGNEMDYVIRDMSNPNEYQQPDTYGGLYWSPNADVHYLSGVGNYFYYLLCKGGSGTNDIGSTFTVKGIGIPKATNILYRTNTVYLTPTSDYADWRTACIQAATDLYGANSNEVMQVKNAWYAVGVGTAAFSVNAAPLAEANAAQLKVNPNPVSGSNAVVKYNLQQPANVVLKITNAYGQLLQTIQTGRSVKGDNVYTLKNLSNLTAGNYYITLEADAVMKGKTVMIISK